MRSLKLFGLAALVAVALTAAIGVAGASALTTQICSTVGNGDGKCTTANNEAEYDGLITATEVSTVLTTNVTNVTCHWHFTLEPASSTGVPSVPVNIIEWFVTGCKTSSGTACTAKTINLPYQGSLSASTFTISDASGAGVQLTCGFLINCTFSTKDAEGEVDHDDTAILQFKGVALERSGGFCPATALLDAEAPVTSPSGLTVDTLIS